MAPKVTETSWRWHGHDAAGALTTGIVSAPGEAAARLLLRERHVQVDRIAPSRSRRPAPVSSHDITAFTRQLATLLDAGVPLVAALDVLSHASDGGGMATLARGLAADVRAGHAFAAAISRQANAPGASAHLSGIDGVYCRLVDAGELSGTLALQLARLAEHRERARKLRDTLRAALAYPCAVTGVALLVIAALLAWVVPEFERLFAGMGAPLPVVTRAVISASRTALAAGPGALAASAGIGALLAAWVRRTTAARRAADRAMLRLPFAGRVIRQAAAVRWARTLGTLAHAGIPLTDAMDAAAAVCGNLAMRQAALGVHLAVTQGATLGAALRADATFPGLVAQMAAVGEESGTLGRMLNKAADLLDEDVTQRLTALSGILEPMMITFLGLVVGGIVMAMYLPMFQLGHAAS